MDTIDHCIAQTRANVADLGGGFAEEQPYLKACLDVLVAPLAPDESLQNRARWCGLFAYQAFEAENAVAIGLRIDTPDAREQSLPTVTLGTVNSMANDIKARVQTGGDFFAEAQQRLQTNQPHLDNFLQRYIGAVFPQDHHFWPYTAALLVHEALERRTGFLPRINRETVDLVQSSLSMEQAAGEGGTLVQDFWKEQPHLLSAVEALEIGVVNDEIQDSAWRYALLTYHQLRIEASLAGWNHRTDTGDAQSLPPLSRGAVGAVMASLNEQGAEAFFEDAQARMERYQPDYFMGVQQAIIRRYPQEVQRVLRPLLLLHEAFEHYGDGLQIQMNLASPDSPPS